MSKLKELEETSNAERIELANQQMLQNALPLHIAQSFPTKSDPYHHVCHSVGIAHINILSDDGDGEAAVRNLKNLICIFDQVNVCPYFPSKLHIIFKFWGSIHFQ
ncbi:unnamed protein product [Onchocerca flexuosa]|uniref:TFR_dimer domain-containing protein n=1 Tax=Onchocerca flexuosa TaxID=387005 RepID=A0A183HLN5_9BILA|nr:unnamed protein product [Onchocerca flexuosa]